MNAYAIDISTCIINFFFFKQKTAYEMRISDLSSDVCSSDLFGESFDRIAGELSQSFEHSKNALTLKGLSFCEAYIEGRARIAVEFRANSAIEADGGSLFSIWAYKGHALNAAPGRNSGWGEKGEEIGRAYV